MANSEKLIKAVKEAYPDYLQMHKLADEGNVWLGRYLDDSSPRSIPLKTILEARSLEELQALAKQCQQKVDVYLMWCEEDPRKLKNK